MYGAGGSPPKEWQYYVKGLVLFIGVLYTTYCVYFAFRRYHSSTWKNGPSQISESMWHGSKQLKTVPATREYQSLSPDVTVVTAYFNLGSFFKGTFSSYTPDLYAHWMKVFARLNNPLIVFTDSPQVYSLFGTLRQNFASNQSQIYLISRNELWSFSLSKEIKRIFNQPNYPVFHPNTVNENYSCVMHAKFELMKKVIEERLYKTRYISWLDIGLFRDVANYGDQFPIQIPPSWNENKIAYSEVNDFDPSLTSQNVIEENRVWVCGAMFLGRPEVMQLFTEDYLKAVRILLNQGLMSTDQQVVYSMYLPSFGFEPRTDVQTYTTHSNNDWFYLGYLIKDLWDKKQREMTPLVRFFLAYL